MTEQDIKIKRSQLAKRSKRKGSSFEREVASLFESKLGVKFARTPQSGGFAKNKIARSKDFTSDIISLDDKFDTRFHVECKNTKQLSVVPWLEQMERDVPKNRIPVLIFHRFNTNKNYVVLDIEQFFELVPKENIFVEKEV